jgi:hypothetical protein
MTMLVTLKPSRIVQWQGVENHTPLKKQDTATLYEYKPRAFPETETMQDIKILTEPLERFLESEWKDIHYQ